MRLIDRYAYDNRLTDVHPAAKAGLALIMVVLCLLLNRPLVGIVALVWTTVLTVRVAGVDGSVFGRLLTAEGTFLLITSIGIALSIAVQPSEQAWSFQIGPFWFSSSPDALQQMILLVTRALGAASALNFLALTTPLTDIVLLLRKLRLPEPLIDVMVVMYRFIFVLLDTLERMSTAQASRLGYHTGYRRGMQNAAQLGAGLFIQAMNHARRLETATAARGFDGTLCVLTPSYRSFPFLAGWILLIVTTMVLARYGAIWLS